MSFDDAFAGVKKPMSRLEREKEQAREQEKANAAELEIKQKAKPAAVAIDSSIWGNVVKKRSRLEMDKERAQAAAKAEEDDADKITEHHSLSKRRKVEQANDYWKQFGNGDFCGSTIKKKSQIEQDKENANKARLQESEKNLKTEGQKKKGMVLLI